MIAQATILLACLAVCATAARMVLWTFKAALSPQNLGPVSEPDGTGA